MNNSEALKARVMELERVEFVAVPLGQSKVFAEQKARIKELEAILAAQEGQEHYCGTCERMVDHRCGDSSCDGPRNTSPAPASALAIVQAALEAAVKEALNMQISPRDIAKNIRAIDPKSILDGMGK